MQLKKKNNVIFFMSLNLISSRSYSYKPMHLFTFLFHLFHLCYCLSAANTTLITGACGFGRASAATIVLSVNKKKCVTVQICVECRDIPLDRHVWRKAAVCVCAVGAGVSCLSCSSVGSALNRMS